MTHTLKDKRVILLIAGVLLAGILLLVSQSKADVNKSDPDQKDVFQNYRFFASTTGQTTFATSTSSGTSTNIVAYVDDNGRVDNGYFVIKGARRVQLYFTRNATSSNSGKSRFSVQTTPNGTDWYDFGKLTIASTTNQTLISRVDITASTSTVPVALNLDFDTFYGVRCIVELFATSTNGVVDGTNLCSASADW